MGQTPSTGHYTVPGGIKLFFNTGTGERDMGNMVDVSLGRESEELEHFTNRPGTRVKDKVITLQESISIDFGLDEPFIENFILFFKGDAITNQGAGTTAVVDQLMTLTTGNLFTSVGLGRGGLTAVSVRQFLDSVFFFDDPAGTFTDRSAEADTAAGTPFAINNSALDFLYCGKKTRFQEITIDVSVGSVGYTAPLWQFWNGTTWTTLTMVGTADFSVDATLTFTLPTTWAQNAINGVTQFWIRFSQTAAAPATPATLLSLGRQAMVENVDHTVDPGSAVSTTTRQDGRIRAIPTTGSLVDGEQVRISYTFVTFTSQITNLVKVGSIEGSARLEVKPQSGRGLSFDIEIPKCRISSNGDLSLNDQEFLVIPLTLDVLDDTANTPVYPYGRIVVYEASGT